VLQRTQEIQQALDDILDELRALPEGTLILVEGSKDEASLRNLGIVAPIERIHNPKTLPEIVKGYTEVVILTDFDRHGGYLAHKSEATVRSFGARPNLEYRRKIRRATLREISHIEGLDTYVRNLSRRPRIH
jgi:5S rRNA maturation endonuclease (ribonuclease M5)